MFKPINIKQVIEVILENFNEDLKVSIKTFATNGNPYYGVDISIESGASLYYTPVFKRNLNDGFSFCFTLEFDYSEVVKLNNNEELLILVMGKIQKGLLTPQIYKRTEVGENKANTLISELQLFVENFLWDDYLNTGKALPKN